MPYLNKEYRLKLIEAKLNQIKEASINVSDTNEKKVKFNLEGKEYIGTYIGDSTMNSEWADIYVGPEYYDNNDSMFNRTPIYNPHEDRKIIDGKFFIPKSELTFIEEESLTEEILSTKKEVKCFEVGSKVKLTAGEYKDKVATVKYCDGGKCVVQFANEQLFIDADTLEACNDKPLSEHAVEELFLAEEELEDDIVVKVDGEVIADTSTEKVESGEKSIEEIPVADKVGTESTEPSPILGVVDLFIRAVQDEYETISFYNSVIGMANESNIADVASVINHINEEENIHVGMLQHLISQLSELGNKIESGKEEAQQILDGEIVHEEKPIEEIKGEEVPIE